MTLLLTTIGLVTLLGQVVLLRELLVAYFGSELVYVLAIGFWLLGSAAGALLGGAVVPGRDSEDKDPHRANRIPGAIVWLLIAFAAGITVGVGLARGLGAVFGGVPGAFLPFGAQLAGMALVLFPASWLTGVLLRVAARAAIARGGSLIRAYAVESAGGALGGGLATLLLMWGVSNLVAGLIAGLTATTVGTAVAWKRGRRWATGCGFLTGLLLLGAMVGNESLDHRMTGWNHPHLAESRDTPYGRVTITAAAGQVALFEDGALVGSSEGTAAEEFAQLAAIQRPAPDSVLVMGFGTGGEVPEILSYNPAKVDWVVVDATVIRWLGKHLPERVGRGLASPAVRLIEHDPRAWLTRAGRYDLIMVAMPEPASGRSNRFFTREFFETCRGHLNPGGVLALPLAASENVWTPARRARAASVALALAGAFDHEVIILPGQVAHVLMASPEPLDRDPDSVAARLAGSGSTRLLVSPAYVRYLYNSDRFAEAALLSQETTVAVNRDARPACYAYSQWIWLSRFLPGMMWRESGLDGVWLTRGSGVALVVAVVVLARLGRRRERTARLLLAGVAGLAGVVLEAVVLLHYQVQQGVLFRDLGLLLTAFMAGLVLGGTILDRMDDPGRRTGFGILGLLTVLAAGTAGVTAAGLATGLPVALGLMLAAGAVTAALLGFASRFRRPREQPLVGPLFAADLIGGCLGSVAATLLLIPVLGLPATTVALAIPILVAVLIV